MQKHIILMRRHRSYSFRRLLRSPALRFLILFFFIWESLYCISLHARQTAALHAPPPPSQSKRIFIAAQHFTSAPLLRSHWNDALVTTVKELGKENIYVSIYESGSLDDTKDALRELDATLGDLHVKRSIILADISREDEIAQQPSDHGWIKTPDGGMGMRRIPFLATIRNHVFDPLERLAAEGEHFDTILFLNDVVFTPEDVLRLLDTNGGNYAAACSLDFSKPPHFYDTFALRDSSGHEAIMQTWPYFRSHTSRHAAQRFLPVPVTSCWNGMVAMPIDPFLGNSSLRFRGIADSLATSHLEASECCLIHADNPLSASKGVFLNPNVKVGYNGSAYDAVNAPEAVLSPIDIWLSLWQNRIMRWFTTPAFKELAVRSRLGRWIVETKEWESGDFCLVNESQVLFESGWKHM